MRIFVWHTFPRNISWCDFPKWSKQATSDLFRHHQGLIFLFKKKSNPGDAAFDLCYYSNVCMCWPFVIIGQLSNAQRKEYRMALSCHLLETLYLLDLRVESRVLILSYPPAHDLVGLRIFPTWCLRPPLPRPPLHPPSSGCTSTTSSSAWILIVTSLPLQMSHICSRYIQKCHGRRRVCTPTWSQTHVHLYGAKHMYLTYIDPNTKNSWSDISQHTATQSYV